MQSHGCYCCIPLLQTQLEGKVEDNARLILEKAELGTRAEGRLMVASWPDMTGSPSATCIKP
jgi:hypothetical protein